MLPGEPSEVPNPIWKVRKHHLLPVELAYKENVVGRKKVNYVSLDAIPDRILTHEMACLSSPGQSK